MVRYERCEQQPTHSRRSAKIDEDFALLQDMVLLVQLDKLEGCTSAVALFLCELVPLVETTFAVLCRGQYMGCIKPSASRRTFFWMAMSCSFKGLEIAGASRSRLEGRKSLEVLEKGLAPMPAVNHYR